MGPKHDELFNNYAKYLLSISPELQKEFQLFDTKIKSLFNTPIDELGIVLKCHLIIENYIDEYLAACYPTIISLKDARLTFSQKLELVNNQWLITFFVYKGVKSLNSLRNKFAHQLSYRITEQDCQQMKQTMTQWGAASGRVAGDGVQLIQEFTSHACLLLSSHTSGISRETPKEGLGAFLSWQKAMIGGEE
jgi:hypothetical protein